MKGSVTQVTKHIDVLSKWKHLIEQVNSTIHRCNMKWRVFVHTWALWTNQFVPFKNCHPSKLIKSGLKIF